jgi:hypothetical protein
MLTLGSVLLGGALAIIGGVIGNWLQAQILIRAERRVRMHNLLGPLAIAASKIHIDANLHESWESEYGLEESNRLVLEGVSETEEVIHTARTVLTRLDLEAPEYKWKLDGTFILLMSGYGVFVDGMRGDLDDMDPEEFSVTKLRQDVLDAYVRFNRQFKEVREELDQTEWERFRDWLSQSLTRKRS